MEMFCAVTNRVAQRHTESESATRADPLTSTRLTLYSPPDPEVVPWMGSHNQFHLSLATE